MSKPSLTAIFAVVILGANAAYARPDIFPSERTDTTGFFGISIPVTPNPKLRVEIGARQTTVGSEGDLTGGELRLSFDPWTLGGLRVRAMVLKGSVDHAGMLGGGWDFATGKPFGSLGVALPHVSGIADIGLNGLTPQFTLGLDSLNKLDPAPYVDHCGQPIEGTFQLAC